MARGDRFLSTHNATFYLHFVEGEEVVSSFCPQYNGFLLPFLKKRRVLPSFCGRRRSSISDKMYPFYLLSLRMRRSNVFNLMQSFFKCHFLDVIKVFKSNPESRTY